MNASTTDESVLHDLYAAATRAEPGEELTAEILERTGVSRGGRLGRRLAHPVASALVLVAVLTGTAFAVSPVRDAIDSVFGTFSGYFADEDSAEGPGRPLETGDDAPRWLTGGDRQDQRLIAETQGYGLYIVREEDGDIGFALGDGFGTSASAASWAGQFADNAVVVLGPGTGSLTPEGRLPVYGVTAASIVAVELTHATGPPTRVEGLDGGFVVMADVGRMPEDIVAYDAAGAEVDRRSTTHIGWTFIAEQSCRVDDICPLGSSVPDVDRRNRVDHGDR